MPACRHWAAWYEPAASPDDDVLHVSGTCGLESSGLRSWLRPANFGNENRELLVLDLMIDRPAGSDDAYVEREMTWSGAVGPEGRPVAQPPSNPGLPASGRGCLRSR